MSGGSGGMVAGHDRSALVTEGAGAGEKAVKEGSWSLEAGGA